MLFIHCAAFCNHIFEVAGVKDCFAIWSRLGVSGDKRMLNLVAFATFFYHAVREKECITCGCVASCVRAINAISDFAIDCSPRVVVSRAKPLEGV